MQLQAEDFGYENSMPALALIQSTIVFLSTEPPFVGAVCGSGYLSNDLFNYSTLMLFIRFFKCRVK